MEQVSYQRCRYQANKFADWKDGLAKVKTFGVHDVEFILNAETGKRLDEIWDYKLLEGPLAYLAINLV